MDTENKKIFWKILIPWMLFVLAILADGYFVYKIYVVKAGNSQNSAQTEATNIINEVGKLIVLPTDEIPTIATVTDLSQLKNQPFFANAKVGDDVLIYSQAQKAILYDPSLNKIVEMAPFSGTGTSSSI
jgi:hypothetical protein